MTEADVERLEDVAYRYYMGELTETQLRYWLGMLSITKEDLDFYVAQRVKQSKREIMWKIIHIGLIIFWLLIVFWL